MLLAFTNLSSAYETHGLLTNPDSLPGAAWFGLINDASWLPFITTSTAFLFLLFPEGRAVGRPRRMALWVGLIAVVLGIVGGLMEANLYSFPMIPNPAGIRVPNALVVAVVAPAFLATVGVLLFSVGNLLVRYRGASGEERLQLRLFTFSVALVLVFFLPSVVVNVASPWLLVLGALALCSIPIAVAVATLKYRLYDLDIVIKKTAVALLLTLLIGIPSLALLAAASVPWLIWAVPNAAFTLVGGVLLGMLVLPLVRVARRTANRIVYGTRATSYEVLTDFSERMADTYVTDDVLARMAEILRGGTGARGATVWLRVGDALRPAAIAGDVEASEDVDVRNDTLSSLPADVVSEVRHHGELLGALTVSMPANDPIDQRRERLLEIWPPQAGAVLRNVRLIEELRASRQRLVAAQDEERRKLERNIHDGAQQQLVALSVKQRLAESLVGKNDERLRALLESCRPSRTERSTTSAIWHAGSTATARRQGAGHRARGAGEEGTRSRSTSTADGVGSLLTGRGSDGLFLCPRSIEQHREVRGRQPSDCPPHERERRAPVRGARRRPRLRSALHDLWHWASGDGRPARRPRRRAGGDLGARRRHRRRRAPAGRGHGMTERTRRRLAWTIWIVGLVVMVGAMTLRFTLHEPFQPADLSQAWRSPRSGSSV